MPLHRILRSSSKMATQPTLAPSICWVHRDQTRLDARLSSSILTKHLCTPLSSQSRTQTSCSQWRSTVRSAPSMFLFVLLSPNSSNRCTRSMSSSSSQRVCPSMQSHWCSILTRWRCALTFSSVSIVPSSTMPMSRTWPDWDVLWKMSSLSTTPLLLIYSNLRTPCLQSAGTRNQVIRSLRESQYSSRSWIRRRMSVRSSVQLSKIIRLIHGRRPYIWLQPHTIVEINHSVLTGELRLINWLPPRASAVATRAT